MQRQIGGKEGYLAAQKIQTGKESVVNLPAVLRPSPMQYKIVLCVVEVTGVRKLRAKLRGARKSVLSILYNQCFQEVKDTF